MAVDSINNYLNTSAASSSSSTATTKTSNSNLNMDDFIKLMVAQLQNQDMYNTTDNSQFMAQMAQYSMVQALTDLKELNTTTYSVSLIGKDVTLATTDSSGAQKVVSGKVSGVNLQNGDTQIVVDGSTYPISSILKVSQNE
jgi:flagellar basal-body rod modification protein FlgD